MALMDRIIGQRLADEAGIDGEGAKTRELMSEKQKMYSIEEMLQYVNEEFVPILAEGFNMPPESITPFSNPATSPKETSVSVQARGLSIALYADGRVLLGINRGIVNIGNINDSREGVARFIQEDVKELARK